MSGSPHQLAKVSGTDPQRAIYNGICHEFTIHCLSKAGYLTDAQANDIIKAWADDSDYRKYGLKLLIKAHGTKVYKADMPTVSCQPGLILGFYADDNILLGHSMQTVGNERLGGVNNAGVMPVGTTWSCRHHTDLCWNGGGGVGPNNYSIYKVRPDHLVDAIP